MIKKLLYVGFIFFVMYGYALGNGNNFRIGVNYWVTEEVTDGKILADGEIEDGDYFSFSKNNTEKREYGMWEVLVDIAYPQKQNVRAAISYFDYRAEGSGEIAQDLIFKDTLFQNGDTVDSVLGIYNLKFMFRLAASSQYGTFTFESGMQTINFDIELDNGLRKSEASVSVYLPFVSGLYGRIYFGSWAWLEGEFVFNFLNTQNASGITFFEGSISAGVRIYFVIIGAGYRFFRFRAEDIEYNSDSSGKIDVFLSGFFLKAELAF